jgi:hypothetical protein
MVASKHLKPEEAARKQIDASLVEAGWVVQRRDEANLSASRGVAISEFKMGLRSPIRSGVFAFHLSAPRGDLGYLRRPLRAAGRARSRGGA